MTVINTDTRRDASNSHVTQCLDANYAKGPTKREDRSLIAVPVRDVSRKDSQARGRRVKQDGDPSFTLRITDDTGVFDGKRLRRLTPLECERLMSFPDGWTEGVSDTARYRLLGNAVIPPVIEYIATTFF